MCKKVMFLVSLVAVLSLAVDANAVINYIDDGDFESGAMGWPNGWGAGSSGTFAPGEGVGGSIGGKTVAGEQYWHGFLDVADVGGDWGAGVEYTMSFQAKASSSSVQIFYGWNGPGYANWAPQVPLTTEWATYSYTAAFPAGKETVSADVFMYQKGAGTMLLDNVSFVPEPATLVLLGIGGFWLRRRR